MLNALGYIGFKVISSCGDTQVLVLIIIKTKLCMGVEKEFGKFL